MSDSERFADPRGGPEPGAGRDETPGRRSSFLPPPAFPPGTRPRPVGHPADGEPSEPAGDTDGAFISPDAPLPPRARRAAEGEMGEAVSADLGGGHGVEPSDLAAAGDPWVLELTERIERLAQALRQRGEAGLHTDPDMDRFDGTLRAYCVGYLAGRRAEGGR